MQLAMIGLGRMGGNMVQRLLQGGHQVVVFDRSADAVKAHVALGAKAAKNLGDLCGQLSAPRVVWGRIRASRSGRTSMTRPASTTSSASRFPKIPVCPAAAVTRFAG